MKPHDLLPVFVATFLAAGAVAQHTSLTVLHGIPGLPAPVEVFANGASLFTFDYTDVRGPLDLQAGTYNIEVRLNGQTVLSASPTLATGISYSAIAHLTPAGGTTLSLFENDTSAVDAGQSRVMIRHTAQAPAVDIAVAQGGSTIATLGPLANPNQIAASLPAGSYTAELFVAGTTTSAFGPVPLAVTERVGYFVYAVGDVSAPSFTLLVQTIDFARPFTLSVNGSACGGAMTTSTATPGYDGPFNLFLSSAPADTMATLLFGSSDTTLGAVTLPLDLAPFGAPGCSLYTDAAVAIGYRTNAAGLAAVSLRLPPDAGIFIAEAYFQWAFASPQNALGMQLTEYAALQRQ